MSYKLFTDKEVVFEANIDVKNASTKGAFARLIVETPDVNLIFNGKIQEDKCIIPIKKLKNILEENTKGTAKLEMVIEDTYFSPWTDECIVEKHTKVQINEVKTEVLNKPSVAVIVKEQEKPAVESKPIVEEKKALTPEELYNNALFELKYVLNKLQIKEYKNNKNFVTVLNEFFSANSEYKTFKKTILKEILTKEN